MAGSSERMVPVDFSATILYRGRDGSDSFMRFAQEFMLPAGDIERGKTDHIYRRDGLLDDMIRRSHIEMISLKPSWHCFSCLGRFYRFIPLPSGLTSTDENGRVPRISVLVPVCSDGRCMQEINSGICPAKSKMPLQNTFSETVATTVHAPTLEDSQRENVLLKLKNAMLQKELDDANNTRRSPEGLFITMRDTSESQVTPLPSDRTGTSTAGHSSPDNPSSGEQDSKFKGGPSLNLFPLGTIDQPVDVAILTSPSDTYSSEIELPRCGQNSVESPVRVELEMSCRDEMV
jgi:hypothetical protein